MARTFFAGSLKVPPSTTWTAPAELYFEMPYGKIVEWFIQGAPEHQHQVSLAIYHLEHRVFPFGEGEYFYPGETPTIFRVETEMTPGVRWIKVRATNTDDTYPHTVYVGVTVEPAVPLSALPGFYVPGEVLEGIGE